MTLKDKQIKIFVKVGNKWVDWRMGREINNVWGEVIGAIKICVENFSERSVERIMNENI